MTQITVSGNATSAPEIKFTQAGKAWARFGIAENHRRKNDRGEWEDVRTDFHDVSVWGDLAEAVADQVAKGAPVTVTGELKSRKNDDGRVFWGIEARSVALRVLPAKRDARPAPQQSTGDPWGGAASGYAADEPAPF